MTLCDGAAALPAVNIFSCRSRFGTSIFFTLPCELLPGAAEESSDVFQSTRNNQILAILIMPGWLADGK
jgi:hypothetical protein